MTSFLDKMYERQRFIEERRSKFNMMKLSFVSGLLGLGTASLFLTDTKTNHHVLLVVPFVAILFDIHTTASSIALREISAFLQEQNKCEKDWANFRGNRQAFLNRFAAVISTGLVTIVSAFLFVGQHYGQEDQAKLPYYLLAYVVALFITIALRYYECEKKREIDFQVRKGQDTTYRHQENN